MNSAQAAHTAWLQEADVQVHAASKLKFRCPEGRLASEQRVNYAERARDFPETVPLGPGSAQSHQGNTSR